MDDMTYALMLGDAIGMALGDILRQCPDLQREVAEVLHG